MSTSFPNNNGNVPPYNAQNGSFNQFGQNAPPPGGFPGMDPYSMYSNGFGGMPAQPNMGGPPQPGGPKNQQYPATGAKPPGYDAMQNGYMQGYRPPNAQQPMPPPAAPPAPNYNMPGNPYNPYSMYSGMPGPAQPTPTPTSSSNRPAATPPAPQRPPSQQPQPPAQYPAQQPLPAHLHPGAPPFSSAGSTPLQHYQPPNYMAPQPTGRVAASLPPLQSPNTAKPPAAKPEAEQRPNSFGGAFPNQPYGGFGGPPAPGSGSNTPSGYPPYGGYPGFGPPPGQQAPPPGQQNSAQHNFGNPGGFNPGFGAPAPNSGQNTPSGPGGPSPFGQNHFGGNASANANGAPPTFENGRGTPGNSNFGTAPAAPGTPGTPGMAPTQSPLAHNPQLPPMYGQNNLMSPSHGNNGNMKPPARSPMGSSLPPLNGQYQGAPEPTFKEPAMPIRQSPSHPLAQPPAYHSQPSTSAPAPAPKPDAKPPSPTFAVPTLPAAVTLAQASSANQVSTKPRTSPQKKKAEDGVPEPPNPETPFTTVTHYELPAALVNLRDALLNKHSNLDKYFARKRQQLRVPYPEGTKVQTTPATEPDTFGFIQGTKYYEEKFNRGIPTAPPAPMGPPLLSRSQSMHATMISPGYNNQLQQQQQQPSTSGRQPAKKARSASDASEPAFNVPLPPSRARNNERQVQQMQQQMNFNQQQMQKMHQHQQQQHQQYMAMMRQGMPPAPGAPGPSNMPPPALQRADSMPALPAHQAHPAQQPGQMMPMNGKGPMPTNSTGRSNATGGLPPLTLGSLHPAGGRASNDFPSTSNHAQVQCAGCHRYIIRGSPTLCCMYHACKNVYHRECTRLSPSAYSQIEQETPHARWVCPTCEPQVRPAPPPMQMQHA